MTWEYTTVSQHVFGKEDVGTFAIFVQCMVMLFSPSKFSLQENSKILWPL